MNTTISCSSFFLLKLTPTVSNVLISKSFLPKYEKSSAILHLMERGKYLILFSSIIFLLFENFVMNPQHPHFPVLPHLSPTLGSSSPLPPKRKTKQPKRKTSSVSVSHTLREAWSNSQWLDPYRKLSPSLSAPLPEATSCEALLFSTLITTFKSSLW